jgi:CheY-like chemotaxis protein
MSARMPKVLIIDDGEEQSALVQHLASGGLISAELLHPNDVTIEDLRSSDLVLVDYGLDDWPERDAVDQLTLRARDGLALSALIRRHVQSYEKDSPTAVAILTGQLDRLASPLPAEHREHLLAHMNNLEWVFQKAKADEESELITQVSELAIAVSRLPPRWGAEVEEPMSELAALLNINSEGLVSEKLLEDVESCNPPIHELSEWSHGLAVLRWLLHKILPYPCFLWDAHYLAARLTIEYKAFVSTLATNGALRDLLGPAKYDGILANFLGDRWWRSRVEFLLWELTDGQSAEPATVRKQLSKRIGVDLPASDPAINPIVCINTDYLPLAQFYSIQESVRIRPDDWPQYADQAWTTKELAKSETKLKSLVLLEDKSRLDQKV